LNGRNEIIEIGKSKERKREREVKQGLSTHTAFNEQSEKAFFN